jgi:predicted transcriptional regulator
MHTSAWSRSHGHEAVEQRRFHPAAETRRCRVAGRRVESICFEEPMASTSVHLPATVVEQLDRLAASRHTSRNRIILQACEELLAQHRAGWPAGYLERVIDDDDLRELQAGGEEMERAILAARRGRPVPAL